MAMSEPQLSESESPNVRLAREIADRLIQEGLIPAAKQRRLFEGLSDGSHTADDWLIFAELALAEKREEGAK